MPSDNMIETNRTIPFSVFYQFYIFTYTW